jgi:ATP-binding cassette subfamily C protein
MGLSYIEKINCIKIQSNGSFLLMSEILSHLQKVSIKNFKNVNIAYFTQKIFNDTDALVLFLITTPLGVMINFSIICYVSFIFIKINYFLVIIFLLLGLVYLLVFIKFKKIISIKKYASLEANNKYYSSISRPMHHLKFIRTHFIYNMYKDKIKYSFNNYLTKNISYNKTSTIFLNFGSFINLLTQLSIYLVLGIMVVNDEISIGNITLLSSYLALLMSSITYFTNLCKYYQEVQVYYKRIMEIFNMSQQQFGCHKAKNIKQIQVDIKEFKHDKSLILNNIRFEMSKGQVYSIVGKNGTGKSTLVDIILGLYPEEFTGKIIYDGINIINHDIVSLRKNMIGISEQMSPLMNSTIRNNIMMNNNYDNNSLTELCKEMGLSDLLSRSELGMETIINESNMNLSGGEKQKISLIRTFIKNPQYIILDEPTASLDMQSKQNLINYINKIRCTKIIMIITHDKDLIEISDKIIEM